MLKDKLYMTKEEFNRALSLEVNRFLIINYPSKTRKYYVCEDAEQANLRVRVYIV